MSRPANTYRGARRNACIRELKGVWGPQWYYGAHNNAPHWAVTQGISDLNKAAIYVPSWGKMGRSFRRDETVRDMVKRGDYAGAMKSFFVRRRQNRRSTGIGGG